MITARAAASPHAQIQVWQRAAPRLAGLAAVGGGCLLVGYELTHNLVVACVLVGVALGGLTLALLGPRAFTALVVCLLPWLVLLIDLTPALTLTLSSALAVLLLLSIAPPKRVGLLPWCSSIGFLVVVLAHAVEATSSAGLQEAAKYSLFPVMALFVASPTGRERLVEMRGLLLASAVTAMAVQAGSIVLHFGATNTYYGTGEQLGLTAESPHELALIGVMVAVACLVSIRDVRWRAFSAAVAATPALATGVRSALVALAVTLLLLAIQSRFQLRTLLGIAAILGAIIFSGVGTIIVNRYQVDQASGEYSSFLTTGSARGTLWTTALHQWASSSPQRLALGYGLRSIEPIEQRSLGESVTAQSDPVSIAVELGLVGLVPWLLVWLALIRSGVRWIVLVPLAVYMVVSGSMEYVGAVVFGIALAGSLASAWPLVGPRPLHPGSAKASEA